MAEPASFLQMVTSLMFPWIFMAMSLSYLPGTILRLIIAGEYSALLSWPRLQDAWFSSFWSWAGPGIRKDNGDRITALFEGRVHDASIVSTPVVKPVGGTVLDLGPGSGYWVDLFGSINGKAKLNASQRKAGEGPLRVYGIEPNVKAHPMLKSHINKAGLDGTYEIIPHGVQSILEADTGIEKGSVDCIVSLLCLCGIPEPEENIRELYSYLKKGGRWYIYEHVQTKRGRGMQLYQAFVNIFWPYALAGCQLCRDTEKSLKEAGPWEEIDLAHPPDEQWFGTVPHIFGTLTK